MRDSPRSVLKLVFWPCRLAACPQTTQLARTVARDADLRAVRGRYRQQHSASFLRRSTATMETARSCDSEPFFRNPGSLSITMLFLHVGLRSGCPRCVREVVTRSLPCSNARRRNPNSSDAAAMQIAATRARVNSKVGTRCTALARTQHRASAETAEHVSCWNTAGSFARACRVVRTIASVPHGRPSSVSQLLLGALPQLPDAQCSGIAPRFCSRPNRTLTPLSIASPFLDSETALSSPGRPLSLRVGAGCRAGTGTHAAGAPAQLYTRLSARYARPAHLPLLSNRPRALAALHTQTHTHTPQHCTNAC